MSWLMNRSNYIPMGTKKRRPRLTLTRINLMGESISLSEDVILQILLIGFSICCRIRSSTVFNVSLVGCIRILLTSRSFYTMRVPLEEIFGIIADLFCGVVVVYLLKLHAA